MGGHGYRCKDDFFSPEIVIQLCVLQLSANVEILVLIAEMSCITSDEGKACSLDLLLD